MSFPRLSDELKQHIIGSIGSLTIPNPPPNTIAIPFNRLYIAWRTPRDLRVEMCLGSMPVAEWSTWVDTPFSQIALTGLRGFIDIGVNVK